MYLSPSIAARDRFSHFSRFWRSFVTAFVLLVFAVSAHAAVTFRVTMSKASYTQYQAQNTGPAQLMVFHHSQAVPPGDANGYTGPPDRLDISQSINNEKLVLTRTGGFFTASLNNISTSSQAIGCRLDTLSFDRSTASLADKTNFKVEVICGPDTPGTPVATTSAATAVTPTTATLNGSIVNNGNALAVSFDWGPSSGLGYANTTTATVGGTIPTGESSVSSSLPLTGLTCGTQYKFRIKAVGTATTYGDAQNFTTSACVVPIPPAPVTGASIELTPYQATLNGTVNPNGFATTATFEWSTNASFLPSFSTEAIDAGSGDTHFSISKVLTPLTCNTNYFYRVSASNSGGTRTSSTGSFLTSACLSTPIMSATPVSCRNGSNGTATAVATGGLAPLSYSWNTSPVRTTSTIFGLTTRTYTVTVTDASGKSTVNSINVSEPSASLALTPATPAQLHAVWGQPFSQRWTATGGTLPHGAISLETTPPDGLSFVNGTLSGTPTKVASTDVNVTVSDANTCSRSSSTQLIVAAARPGAPAIGTATAGNAQAHISFSAPASDGGATLTYKVVASPSQGSGTCNATSLNCTVTGLTNGTLYRFTVIATNTAGDGNPSPSSNSVTPKSTQTIAFANPGTMSFGSPRTLTATADSGLAVSFTSQSPGVCSVTSAGVLTAIATGQCRVTAIQAGSNSVSAATDVLQEFSITAVAPDAPTIGTATAGNAQVRVTFTAPQSNGGSPITGYSVTADPANGNSTCNLATAICTVTGLTNGTAYRFSVKAVSSAGSSVASALSNLATPIAPQTITFNQPDTLKFGTPRTLTATSTSDLVVTFTGQTPGVCTVTSAGVVTAITTGECEVTAHQPGDKAYEAATAVPRTFNIVAVAPDAPTIGAATAGNAQASVRFTVPATNGGAAITGYSVATEPAQGSGTCNTVTLTCTVTGLTNGTAYKLAVKAINSANSSAASALSNAVTPIGPQTISFANPGSQKFGASPTLTASSNSGLVVAFSSQKNSVCTVTSAGVLTTVTTGTCTVTADQAGNAAFEAATSVPQSFTIGAVVPDAPTIGAALPGNAQARVSFAVPASNGGSDITGYSVTAVPAHGSGTCDATALSCTITGLTNGTAYTFQVLAKNTEGNGLPSAASNPVTPSADLVFAAAAPTIALPPATVGTSYSSGSSISVSGGLPPYTFTLTGTLPSGLVLNPATGEITGTPTESGTSRFSITVGDTALLPLPVTATATAQKSLAKVVSEPVHSATQAFSLQVEAAAPIPTFVKEVPTLSQWSLMGLSLLLAMLGLARMRRR